MTYSTHFSPLKFSKGAVKSCRVAQWIRPRTLTREVLGPNHLAAVVFALKGKALNTNCLYSLSEGTYPTFIFFAPFCMDVFLFILKICKFRPDVPFKAAGSLTTCFPSG